MTVIDTVKKQIVLKRAGVVVAALCWPLCAAAQAPYTLVDLGVVGAAGGPNHIANNDISVGSVQGSGGNDHAVIYFDQHIIDISKPGLGGANSLAYGNNPWGEVVGGANIANVDPKKEDFCGFQALGIATATASCRPFLWWGGQMIALPTLDNNHGEAAGTTGTCGAFNLTLGYYMNPLHAVLWEKDGTPINLGSLGGNEKSLMGNAAKDLNSRGDVVGFSSLPDNATVNAFLWTRETGKMKALVPIKGIANSIAIALNDSDEVVGSSINSTFTTLTATIWKHGVPADLNTLIPANSSLNLLFGCSINSRGQILGLATNLAGTVYHAYELIPVGE